MIAMSMQNVSVNSHQNSSSPTQLSAGDLDAFNAVVVAHQDAVYRQALWLLGEPEAAEDATQEAFIRAYQKINSFHGGPFRPWILRIVSNYCIDQLRRAKVRPSIPLELYDENDDEMETPFWMKDPSAPVEEIIARKEQGAVIRRCLANLSMDYRNAIILADIQELDYSEAAAAMGVSMGTFKSRLFRARLQVQRQLKQYEPSGMPLAH